LLLFMLFELIAEREEVEGNKLEVDGEGDGDREVGVVGEE